jgi:hypothetical protein
MISRMLCLLLLCLGLCVQAGPAWAQDATQDLAQVTRVEPAVRDGELYIDADIDFDVSSELRDAAEKGVPIYFTADLEIVERRWWWFDRSVVDKQLTWRVVYNALTRQWRVGTGDLSLPEASLNDSLSVVRHIRGWAVASLKELDSDRTYHGKIRLRLDTSRLARPFQINALNSSAWSMTTPWKDFTFSVSVADPS